MPYQGELSRYIDDALTSIDLGDRKLIPVSPRRCDARIELLIQLLSPCFQPPDELFFSWQGELVFSRQHLVSQNSQRVVSDSRVVFRAEDQADRGVFLGVCPMFAGVIQIKIHLSGVGVCELPQLQFDDDQRTQSAVKEE